MGNGTIPWIDEILNRYGFHHESLIGILQEIQRAKHHLPKDALKYVARRLDVPLARIFQIATFYKSFSLNPKGRHQIRVCMGTACHLKGALLNAEEFRRRLAMGKEDAVTPDLSFSLETVNCLGTCALAPVIMVNEEYYDQVTPAKVRRILKALSRTFGEASTTPEGEPL